MNKTLSPDNKILIYQIAIDQLENRDLNDPVNNLGVCRLLYVQSKIFLGDTATTQAAHFYSLFPEFKSQKPYPISLISAHDYWWPFNESGRQSRIKALTRAIHICRQQKDRASSYHYYLETPDGLRTKIAMTGNGFDI